MRMWNCTVMTSEAVWLSQCSSGKPEMISAFAIEDEQQAGLLQLELPPISTGQSA